MGLKKIYDRFLESLELNKDHKKTTKTKKPKLTIKIK